MKVIKGEPPEDIRETHAMVMPWFVQDLENYGVPIRRYSKGLRCLWAERWACVLVNEWTDGLVPHTVETEDVLRRIVSYVLRTRELDFPEACLVAYRLDGLGAVLKMLEERKDLVR